MKFKKIAKIGFGRKNQLNPQCVCIWANGKGYTSIYEAWSSLFCHAKISQTMTFHVVLLVSLERSWWVGMPWLGLKLFGAMVWKLFIIEPFFNEMKLNKKWNMYWNLEIFLVLLESFQSVRFNRIYFTNFKAKVWKYWFFDYICCWKFKQITKFGFEKKNQLSPQCVHTWANNIGYISLYHVNIILRSIIK